MMLSDLIFATVGRIFHPPPAPKTAERKLLQVPLHQAVDRPQMQPVLAAAAAQLATSGLLYKWLSTDGTAKLCRWDSSQKMFTRGTVEDWAIFIGEHFIVRDTNNIEYRGPSITVTDRLIYAILKHPATPVASWAEQLRRKRDSIR